MYNHVTFIIPSRPELFLIIYSFEIISIIKLKNGTMDLLVRFICLMQGWGNIGLKRSVPLGILHLSPHTPLLWYCWLSTREIKKTFWLHTRHQELGSLGKDYKKKNLQSYVIKNEKNLQKCDAFTYTCNIDLTYIVPNIDLENIFSKEVNMKYKIM